MREQRFDLGPGTPLVIVALAQGRQAGIPVPLERIKPLRRNGIDASVVGAQNLDRFLARNLPRGDIALSYLYWIPESMFMVLPAAVLLALIGLVGGQVILERGFGYDTALSIIIEFLGGIVFLLLILRKPLR